MADVHQWRRRIQPGFPRSLMPVGEQDEPEPVVTSGFGSSRKKVRPKISSYFSHRIPSSGHNKSSLLSDNQRISLDTTASPSYETWPEGREPDLDQIMDSIMRTLMAEPYRPLDVKHNSPLLMVFEGFRNLRDENADLRRRLSHEVDGRLTAQHGVELERQSWLQEREEYKAEIKRLELIIAQDKADVAGVMRARQGSILQPEHRRRTTSGVNAGGDDPGETVFEFLKRTRVEDEVKEEAARRAQRASLRNRPVSPSQKMAVLSHKISTTSHYNDLPFDSPPSPQEFTSLSQASMFEILAGSSPSSDTDSSENNSIHHRPNDATMHRESVTTPDGNTSLLGRNAVSCRQPTRPTTSRAPSYETNHTDRLGVRNKKSRPESLQLGHMDHIRRFSFEIGDDVGPVRDQTQHTTVSAQRSTTSAGHFAPKLASSSPQQASSMLAVDRALTSPALAPLIDSPRASKIPSPVFDPSLARPRREGSTSSFLTAIRAPDSDMGHSRGISRSSNNVESPYLSSRNSFQSSGDSINSQRNSARYSSMQDVNMALAAARAAGHSCSPNPPAELRGQQQHHTNA